MSADDWEEVDQIRDVDGVMAVITKKKTGHPRYAIGIFKVFKPNGSSVEKKTMWVDADKLDAVIRVTKLAQDKITDLALQQLATSSTSSSNTNGSKKTRPKA